MNATKQRLYEWKEKLPVQRHNHARGSTVYAFLKELEAMAGC